MNTLNIFASVFLFNISEFIGKQVFSVAIFLKEFRVKVCVVVYLNNHRVNGSVIEACKG